MDDLKSSSLSIVEKGKSCANIGTNIMTLSKGLQKLNVLKPLAEEAKINMEKLLKSFKGMVDNADEGGK